MPGHALPRVAKALEDRSLLLHICTNPDFIARKWYYHSIQRPSMCKTQKAHQQQGLHAPPQSLNEPRPSPSNMCKSADNFRKRTIPGDSKPSTDKTQKFQAQESIHAPFEALTNTASTKHAPPSVLKHWHSFLTIHVPCANTRT